MGGFLSTFISWLSGNLSKVGLMPDQLGPEADVPDPDSSLTPRETAYITETWAIVKTDLKTHGLKFFLLLFETHPHIQNQFKPFADVPIELLITSVSLAAHGMRVLKALDSYIENLDDVSVVVELLKINGHRHHSIGIDLKDFELTYEVILQYLGEALGPIFTKAAHAAWVHLLKVVHSVLLKAYEERDEEIES